MSIVNCGIRGGSSPGYWYTVIDDVSVGPIRRM